MIEMNCLECVADETDETNIMTVFQPEAEAEKLQIPLDLSEWCEKAALLAWTKELVETLEWSNANLVAYLRAHPGYEPKIWLHLLIFAYSTGIFESEEIVRLCHADDTFRSICAGVVPSQRELSIFRRENRGLLKSYLTEILKRALREKFALGKALLPAGLRQFLVETATVRLDIARHVDRAAGGA
jgi:transposase